MYPIVDLLQHCRCESKHCLDRLSTGQHSWTHYNVHRPLCAIIFDALAFITTLVVGVLAALGVISMPFQATCALLGTAGIITLLYTTRQIVSTTVICAIYREKNCIKK